MADVELDTLGLICPLPVLKLRKAMMGLGHGQTIRVLSDDPVAVIDIPNWCRENGHELVASDKDLFVIRKG